MIVGGDFNESLRESGLSKETQRVSLSTRKAYNESIQPLVRCTRTALSGVMMAALKLDKEYRLTRAALINAGVDMAGSMDALYRDWRRWRDKTTSLASVDREGVANADQWWSRHLAQFRCLIDPLHVAARVERARKDRRAARARSHSA